MAADLSAWKERAELARRQAEAAISPETRQTFLAVAHMWDALIEQCDNAPLFLLFGPGTSPADSDKP
jgi:hypothetical protein